MSMKNSNDTNGNRTRNLPACSAVPQTTAPSRVPEIFRGGGEEKKKEKVPCCGKYFVPGHCGIIAVIRSDIIT